MKTITAKVKFKITEANKTKTVKAGPDFPKPAIPCFAGTADGIYKNSDPKSNRLFGAGYITGAGQVFN